MLDVGLVRMLALHFHNKIEILLPNDELLDRRGFPYFIQRLYGFLLDPLIIVVLLPHGHLPNRRRLPCPFVTQFLPLRVVVKIIVFGRVGLIADSRQVETAEFEALRVGHYQLVDALQELNEHRRRLAISLSLETEPFGKGVPEGDELLLDEEAEPVDRAEEGINDELDECGHLCCAIECKMFLQEHFLSELDRPSFTYILLITK